MGDSSSPTLSDVNNALAALPSQGPTLSDVNNALAALPREQTPMESLHTIGPRGDSQILQAFGQNHPNAASPIGAIAGGILAGPPGAIAGAGLGSLATNVIQHPTEPVKVAKNVTKDTLVNGVIPESTAWGVGKLAEGGLGALINSGKASITGLFSHEGGLHPIVEMAEDGAPEASTAAQRLNLNLNALKMNEPLFPKVAESAPAVTESTAPVAETASHGGFLSKIPHVGHILSSPTMTGAAIGGYMAHKADLPESVGAVAGGIAGPLAVQAFLKTKNGLLPIMANPAVQEAAKTYFRLSNIGDDNDAGK